MAKNKREEPTASNADVLLAAHRTTMGDAERKEFDEFFAAMNPAERVEFVDGLNAKITMGDIQKADFGAELSAIPLTGSDPPKVTITQVDPVSGEDDPFLSPAELGRLFSRPSTTIIRWIKADGWLPYFEIGPHRHIRVRKSVAEAKLRQQKQNLIAIRLPNDTSLTSITQNK